MFNYDMYCDLFVWIAAFGFSELLIDLLNIKSVPRRVMYYSFCIVVAYVISSNFKIVQKNPPSPTQQKVE